MQNRNLEYRDYTTCVPTTLISSPNRLSPAVLHVTISNGNTAKTSRLPLSEFVSTLDILLLPEPAPLGRQILTPLAFPDSYTPRRTHSPTSEKPHVLRSLMSPVIPSNQNSKFIRDLTTQQNISTHKLDELRSQCASLVYEQIDPDALSYPDHLDSDYSNTDYDQPQSLVHLPAPTPPMLDEPDREDPSLDLANLRITSPSSSTREEELPHSIDFDHTDDTCNSYEPSRTSTSRQQSFDRSTVITTPNTSITSLIGHFGLH